MANHGDRTYVDNAGYSHYTDGTTSYEMGGRTFYSDGDSSYELGGRTFYSDGTSSYTIGHTVVHDDGSTTTDYDTFASELADILSAIFDDD